jgi:signal transduction histidine kinase
VTRVLVIEDSKTQAARVRATLVQAGYDVRVAENGELGLTACRAWKPELVLCDVLMPGLDGYEVTRAIKADPELRGVAVVIMTSLDAVDDLVNAMRAGADNYVTKPFDEERLLRRLQNTVDPRTRSVNEQELLSSMAKALEARPLSMAMFISSLEDAVERTRALLAKQEELTRTNVQREELMRVVAHELRGPLQSLAMRAAIAREAPEHARRLDELPVEIDKQVRSMVRIIDDLSDLTALDLGTLELVLADIPVDVPVRAAVSDAALQQPNRAVHIDLAPSLNVRADATRIQQVVANFLTNAIKYSADATPLAVAARRTPHGLRVEVTDRGVGIAPELCDRVFERYFRVEDTRRDAKGVGLGLYICRRIIELHGGRIGVESRLGEGSTFWFELPSS